MADTMSLTHNLAMELEKTNQSFTRWSENQKDWLEANDANFARSLEECEFTISALRENELQLESARSINDQIKGSQKAEIENCISQIERLKQQKKSLDVQLRKYEEEEEREGKRLETARSEHNTHREKMEQTLNDLTHGIRQYMALGLEFQKAEGDCMKFIFTQVDPANPNKQFYFLMFVDTNDRFQLVETCPPLDPAYCLKHLQALNGDSNVGRFVVSMRRGFLKLVK